MGTMVRSLFAMCLLVSLLLCPCLLSGQEDPTATMDPATKAYAQWLITGKGKKPDAPASVLSSVPFITEEKELVGDLQTEAEYYEHTNPGSGRWPVELRLKAYEQSQLMSEDLDPKQQSLSSPPSQWTLRGPIGMEHRCVPDLYWSGRVTCIDYSPTRGIYLGTVGGGLWAPLIFLFVPVTEKFPTQTAGGIAINPATPDIIFYGTGDYGTQLGGNGTGTYRSTDAGVHWTPMAIAPTPSKTARVIIAPWDYDVVFVAGNTGIFKSTNSGGSWTRTATWDASDITSNPTGSVMLAGRASTGVYKSTNQGDSWQPLTTDLPSNSIGYIRVEISKSNANRAYVVIARPNSPGSTTNTGQVRGVYRTDNLLSATVNWWDLTPNSIGKSDYMYGQGWYHNALAVDPTNSNNVFIGGGALLKSTNAGVDWNNVTTFPHADIKVLFFRPGDNLLYGGGDGGVFTSGDLGATWSPILNRLLPTTLFYNIDVSRSNDDVVFGASQDNATEGTYPGARNVWRVSNIADGIDASIDWSNESTIFTTTQYGDVFKSTTGGGECDQWPWLNNGKRKTEWSAYMFQDPASYWIYYNGGKYVYYSSNRGDVWAGTVNPDSLGGVVVNIAVNSDGNYVYAITNNVSQRLNRFRWTGSVISPSWEYTNISSGTPGTIPQKIIPSLSTPGRAYALFNGSSSTQRIYKTTNNGTVWVNVTGNFVAGVPLHDLVESPYDQNILWIGTDLGVYKSTNGGTTWWWWNKGMPDAVVVNDMEYAYSASGDYLVAGTFGRSTFERDVNAPIYIYTISGIKGPYDFSFAGDLVIGALDSGKIGKSTDRGSSWETISGPLTSKVSDVHAFDSLIWLIAGENGQMYRTTNGGQLWGQIVIPTQSNINKIAFDTEMHGWAVGDGGVILQTGDGGQTWNDASPGIAASFFDITFTDPLNGFAVGVLPGQIPMRILARTADGGEIWNVDQNLMLVGSFFDITFSDPMHGFCTGDNGFLVGTKNGGQTWDRINLPTNQSLFGSFFDDQGNGWLCGSGGTILRTSDGGTSWNEEETGSTDTVFAIGVIDGTLLAGGSGGMLTRTLAQRTSVQFGFNDRWNMVSVPMTLNDYGTSSVFPTASSQAFAFQGQYAPQSILANGPGYWLKFDNPTLQSMDGFLRNREVIDVAAGWNLIGSISSPIPADNVLQQPADIVSSRFFGYSDGYNPATMIEPSRAYWVKVNASGQLILDAQTVHLSDSSGTPIGPSSSRTRSMMEEAERLTVTDKNGAKQTLYFMASPMDPKLLTAYDMPPAPPAGAFDARFSNGALIVSSGVHESREAALAVTSAAYPLTIEWTVHPSIRNAHLVIDGTETILQNTGRILVTNSQARIALRLPAAGEEVLPVRFMLDQNYPNPFNPETVIRYKLPVASHVSLKVYNTLGQEVATLVYAPQAAGHYDARMDATAWPAGVYFYQLRAGNYSEMKKMILVK